MLRDRFLKRFFIMAIVLVALTQIGVRELAHFTPHNMSESKAPPALSAARTRHILYGDARGGGHLHGMNRPCKSEFPADWTAEDIIQRVTRDAANDNLDWRHEKNGNDVADTREDGITIRIVVNGRHDQIITAYPLSTPRNPCPAANDNGD